MESFVNYKLKQEGSRMRIGDYAVRILVNNTGSRGMQLIKGNQYIWIHDGKKAMFIGS